jgi:hypothetical protein
MAVKGAARASAISIRISASRARLSGLAMRLSAACNLVVSVAAS